MRDMQRGLWCVLLAWVACFAAALPAAVVAQAVGGVGTDPAVLAAAVEADLAALTGPDGPDDATRQAAGALLRDAATRLEAAAASHVRAAARREVAENGRAMAVGVRAKKLPLTGGGVSQDSDVAHVDTPTEVLEQRLAERRTAAAALRAEIAELDAAAAGLEDRPVEARVELAEARQKVETLTATAADAVVDAGEDAAVGRARTRLLAARWAELTARVAELEQELLALPNERDLTAARRELAVSMREREDAGAAELEAVIGRRRSAAAVAVREEAEIDRLRLAGGHPALVRVVAANAAAGERLAELAAQGAGAETRLRAARARLDTLQRNARDADQILSLGAVSEEFGELVRELRQKLPDVTQLERETAERGRVIVNARLRELRLAAELRTLEAGEGLAAAAVDDPPLGEADTATLAQLVGVRYELLQTLLASQREQVENRVGLNDQESRLLAVAEALASRLDERLVWLPSAAAVGRTWPGDVAQGARWLTDPTGWREVADALGAAFVKHPLLTALVALLAVLLGSRRRMLRERRKTLSNAARGVATDRFSLTPMTFLLTLLLVLPVPLAVGYVGWQLRADPSLPGFARAVGAGLLASSLVALIVPAFRRMTDADGVFGAHFGWSEATRKVLGRNLGWFAGVESAAVFVVVACDFGQGPGGVYHHGLGRLAFMVGSLALAWFMFRVLHPRRGALAGVLRVGSWIDRLRVMWFPVVVAVPVVLGLLAARGYYATASQIQDRLFTTAWVVLLAVTVHGMGVRWVVVAHRRLAVQRHAEARVQAMRKRAKLVAEKVSGDAVPENLEVPAIDPAAVSQQTRTLLRVAVGAGVTVALWLIWAGLVPALGVLNNITLWTTVAAAEPAAGLVERVVPVTLFGALVAGLILALTWVAGRNVPGLLEISVLQRLALDAGTRYAVTTVCRYVITAVGLLLAFDKLGLPWSRFQWIVAALGVGLGFGLQEIVANFVSGLIILFERPVRVGDTVTVNGLSGTVSRIQIRATTIVDWDNREILVPNKSFITDQVVNWTLSSPVTRVVIKVGVGYGSDPDLAYTTLLNAAKENVLVLSDPAPTVFFLGFGDSALDFELRVFVRELSKRLVVTHELHATIHRALAAAGIEIPFPQRDLHVRSGPEGATLPAGVTPPTEVPRGG